MAKALIKRQLALLSLRQQLVYEIPHAEKNSVLVCAVYHDLVSDRGDNIMRAVCADSGHSLLRLRAVGLAYKYFIRRIIRGDAGLKPVLGYQRALVEGVKRLAHFKRAAYKIF